MRYLWCGDKTWEENSNNGLTYITELSEIPLTRSPIQSMIKSYLIDRSLLARVTSGHKSRLLSYKGDKKWSHDSLASFYTQVK